MTIVARRLQLRCRSFCNSKNRERTDLRRCRRLRKDAGFSGVSKLTKDDQGIWRGQATKAGKTTAVALDYQGNVVAGTN
jgi:hypothetical protein